MVVEVMTWALFIVGAALCAFGNFRVMCLAACVMCLATALHVHAFGWQP